jgi:hypothetical protein
MGQPLSEPIVLTPSLTMPLTASFLFNRPLGSPALGTATAVHAAVTDTGAPQVITTAITNPDATRCVTATPGGTTANVTAVSCTVKGTDIGGAPLTEVLPPFTAGAATAVTGLKAFATITEIDQPAIGTGVTVSYGLSAKLGLPRYLFRKEQVLRAYLNHVVETTAPTVLISSTDISQNVITLNSALNGNPVSVDLLSQ